MLRSYVERRQAAPDVDLDIHEDAVDPDDRAASNRRERHVRLHQLPRGALAARTVAHVFSESVGTRCRSGYVRSRFDASAGDGYRPLDSQPQMERSHIAS